jgi:hypothetical protein
MVAVRRNLIRAEATQELYEELKLTDFSSKVYSFIGSASSTSGVDFVPCVEDKINNKFLFTWINSSIASTPTTIESAAAEIFGLLVEDFSLISLPKSYMHVYKSSSMLLVICYLSCTIYLEKA